MAGLFWNLYEGEKYKKPLAVSFWELDMIGYVLKCDWQERRY